VSEWDIATVVLTVAGIVEEAASDAVDGSSPGM